MCRTKKCMDILGKYVKEPKKHMTASRRRTSSISFLTASRRIMPHRTLTRTLQRSNAAKYAKRTPRREQPQREQADAKTAANEATQQQPKKQNGNATHNKRQRKNNRPPRNSSNGN